MGFQNRGFSSRFEASVLCRWANDLRQAEGVPSAVLIREKKRPKIKHPEGAVSLRHTTLRKNGKRHTYGRLVRSLRIGRKVRQETVAPLGELAAQGRREARRRAASIVGIERPPGRFDDQPPAPPLRVDRRGLPRERGRRFGDVGRARRRWQAVGLDERLERLMPLGREAIPWPPMAEVRVIARRCAPSRERHLAEDGWRRTALGDRWNLPEENVNDARRYRAWDRRLPHKEALKARLKQRWGTHFGLEYDRLLDDITRSDFEGLAPGEERASAWRLAGPPPGLQARLDRAGRDAARISPGLRGVRRQSQRRDDASGDRPAQRSAFRARRPDRGMVRRANRDGLRRRRSRHLVGTPHSALPPHARHLLSGDGTEVREGLEVPVVASENEQETFLLGRSADRAAQQRALRERFEQRLQTGREPIQKACDARRGDPGVIERRLGRRRGRNPRAAGHARSPCRGASGLVEAIPGSRVGGAARGLLSVAQQGVGGDAGGARARGPAAD